jgi:hypothetical protein
MYVVEQNIPAPSGKSRYPFDQMGVGDSFLVTDRPIARVSASAHAYGKVHGQKFSCRSLEGGIRVWRVR